MKPNSKSSKKTTLTEAAAWIVFILVVVGSLVVFSFYLFPNNGTFRMGINPAILNQETTKSDSSAKDLIEQFKIFPFTGYHSNPNVHAEGKVGWVNYKLSTNNYGFISKYDFFPYENKWPKKQPGEKVVLLTGLSTAAGFGATTNETTLSYVLEDLLNQTDKKHKWKVVNLANAGWVAYQEYIALDLYGTEMEPDWIVVFDGRGDLVVGTMHGEDIPGYLFFKGQKMLNELFDDHPEDTETLPFLKYRRLSERLEKMTSVRPAPKNTYEDLAKAAHFYLHSIESILLRWRGQNIILATQPDIGVYQPGSIIDAGYKIIIPQLQNLSQTYHGVQYLNGTQLFPFEEKYFADGCHLTDLGQRIFAQKFADMILGKK